MKSCQCLAAHSDDKLRYLAERKDEEAHKELVRRGLAYDPTLLKRTKDVSKKISFYELK